MSDLLSHAWSAFNYADWNTITAYPAFLMGMYVIVGCWRYVLWSKGLVFNLFMAGFLGFGSYHWRMGYWDLAPRLLGDDRWQAWFEVSNGTSVNVFWNVVSFWACYHFLEAMRLSIPKGEWQRECWLFAPLYPPIKLMYPVRKWIRNKRKAKSQKDKS